MAGPVVYVDHSRVRDGMLPELEVAVKELAAFVEAEEPGLLAYDVYVDADRHEMTVVHVHRDSESLAFHMRVAGPRFAGFERYVELLAIDVYGDVDGEVVDALRKKAELLGSGVVRRHDHVAGFLRAEPPA